MKEFLGQLKQKQVFLAGLILFFVLSIGWLLYFSKGEGFIKLNPYHSPGLDMFFTAYTYVGDGLFAIGVVVICFFAYKNKKYALSQLIAYLFSGLLAQLLKALVYAPRPKLFLIPGQYAHFVNEVTLSNGSSFPSGHTATAFAMAMTFVLMTDTKRWQLPLLLAAILVGYSRIYLGQHFLLDVLTGAIIGVVSGWVTVVTMDHYRLNNLYLKNKKM